MSCAGLWPFRWPRAAERQRTNNHKQNENSSLKLLYTSKCPRVDIVAIHGLNGHRERSWTAPNGVNWLHDILPSDVPDSRIHTWGYKMSAPTPSPRKVSEALVSNLWEMREVTGQPYLPIIFVAHSLGGSIVKSALIFSNSAQDPSRHFRSIFVSTCGVVFIDTPELDSSFSGLQKFLDHAEPSGQDNSVEEARWLLDTLQQYKSIGDGIPSVLVKARPDLNNSSDCQEGAVLTTQKSLSRIMIDTDHESVNKFDSRRDKGYLRMKEHLIRMMQTATSKTSEQSPPTQHHT